MLKDLLTKNEVGCQILDVRRYEKPRELKIKKMAFKFEQLRVWQKSLELTSLVHITAKLFLKDELFYFLTSQIKSSRFYNFKYRRRFSEVQSNREFVKFLKICFATKYRSGKVIFVPKEDIISKENFEKIYSMSEEILAMISALIKRLENE
ncbi:MAG: four helix bundle protein [Cloacibacterium normanense]